jgi:hypothetical protein
LLAACGGGSEPPPPRREPPSPPAPVTVDAVRVKVVERAVWIEADLAARRVTEDMAVLVAARCRVDGHAYFDEDGATFAAPAEASLFEALFDRGGAPERVEGCELAIGMMDLGTPVGAQEAWCWSRDAGAVRGRCAEPIDEPVPAAARLDRVRFEIEDRIRVEADYLPSAATSPRSLEAHLACGVGGVVYADDYPVPTDVPPGTRAHLRWFFFDPLHLPARPTTCELTIAGVGQVCHDARGVTDGACPGLVRVSPPVIALADVTLETRQVGVPEVTMNAIRVSATRPAGADPVLGLALTCSDGDAWTAPWPADPRWMTLRTAAPGETEVLQTVWQSDRPTLGCDVTFTREAGAPLARYCLTPTGTTPWTGACLSRRGR